MIIPFQPGSTLSASQLNAAFQEVQSAAQTAEAAAIEAQTAAAGAAAALANSVNKIDLQNGDGSTVGFSQGTTPAKIMPLQKKLMQFINVNDFIGVDPTGTTECSAQIQAVLNLYNEVVFSGNYLISTGLTFTSGQVIRFTSGSSLKAGANNINLLSCSTGYGSRLYDPCFDSNGKTGVSGLIGNNIRTGGACIHNITFKGTLNNGMVLTNSFGITIANPSSWAGVANPIVFRDNCSSCTVINPQFDNETSIGGTGIGVGIQILKTNYGNTGIKIIGGYIQGFDEGVLDSNSYGTQIEGTYFEANTIADVSSVNAQGYKYEGCQHWASVGAVAYLGRNCDAGMILQPALGSGGRANGLFDYDATNSNCYYLNSGSHYSLNQVTATAIGISAIAKEQSGTFTPIVSGSATAGTCAYTSQIGSWRKVGQQTIVDITVAFTGHTGSGGCIVSGIPSNLNYAFPVGSYGRLVITGMLFTGPQLAAQFNGTNANLTLIQIGTSGAATFVPFSASGTINIQMIFTSDRTLT